MTILLVSTGPNKLSSILLNEKGERTSIVQTIDAIIDPLPLSAGDHVSTDWLVRHPKFNLVYVLTSFGTNMKALLTTYRIYNCGSLRSLATCESGGYHAAHACLNPAGTALAVAHAECGHVAIFDVSADAGCNGPPTAVIRLPILFPQPTTAPAASRTPHHHQPVDSSSTTDTALSEPSPVSARGLCYSPNGDFLCIAEPNQSLVVTFLSNADTGKLKTRPAYEPKNGLPPSNSAFSVVQTETDLQKVLSEESSTTWKGPQVSKVALHPSGSYLYALQEQSCSIAVYQVESIGMIVPKLLQELFVAELSVESSWCWGTDVSSACTTTDLQAFQDGLLLSISSRDRSAADNGIVLIDYVDNNGASLRLAQQQIVTVAPVRNFVRDDKDSTLWVGLYSQVRPYVQKYQKKKKAIHENGVSNGTSGNDQADEDDAYEFVGQAFVGGLVQCLIPLDETTLPAKPAATGVASHFHLSDRLSQNMDPTLLESLQARAEPALQRQKGKDLRAIHKAKFHASFLDQDVDGSGFMEQGELATMLEKMGEPCAPQDVQDFMKQADADNDGRLDFEEFYAHATGQNPTAETAVEAKRRQLKTLFDMRDEDGSGYLEASEMQDVLAGMGQQHSPEAVQEFMDAVDKDGDGRVDFEEFYAFATGQLHLLKKTRVQKAPKPKKDSPEEERRKELKREFDKHDENGSGYLEFRELGQVLAAFGEPCSRKDVAAFLKQVDKDGDFRIDFEEFYAFATEKAKK